MTGVRCDPLVDWCKADFANNIVQFYGPPYRTSNEPPALPEANVGATEQNAKLALATSLAGVGLWELDVQTHALELCERCQAYLGFDAAAIVTYLALLARVHPCDRVVVEATFDAALASGSDFAVEFRIVLADESVRWISANGRRFDEGRPRLAGAMIDVTLQRNAAAAFDRALAERTHELHETVRELEDFAYSVSHDLRAPLRSVRTYAEVLLQECGSTLTPHGRHYIDRLFASTKCMDRLIQDVLAFTRLSRSELLPEPLDIDRLTRGIVDQCQVSCPEACIEIVGALPRVMGNATAFTQCLSNLLDNAVKFVAAGAAPHVRIWADPAIAHDDAGWIRLHVQDNGIGIAPESHARIFEMFHRLGGKRYEGTGVGLAIVQKAIARMGGSVGVSSGIGQGSTFWIELQRALVPASATRA